jgi:hypothetical protein
LWLNATGAPAEVAARAGTSTRILHQVYLHCTGGQDDVASGSKTPSTQAQAAPIHHDAGQRAVIRTVGTTADPVRCP